ncbi:MAG TPA: hypothetical protein PK156_26685 [Polyangium sp.]|nr:hypothetical protein [Polyangium sp.]
MSDDRAFQKQFFRALTDEPITDPNDEWYVRLYDDPAFAPLDPVEQLWNAIDYTRGSSIHLLSGYRGTGKTTELYRLAAKLPKDQYKVVHVFMENYLNMATPVDVSDFLLAVACAFGEGLHAHHLLDRDPREETGWSWIRNFFKTADIQIPELSVVGIKTYLKSELSFRNKIHERMGQHLDTLVASVRAFVQECAQALRKRWGQDTEFVLLVGSIEHLHGTYLNGKEVQDSVSTLFGIHAEKLAIPYLHIVYTVPPYLSVLSPGAGQGCNAQAVHVFPAVKVHERDRQSFSPGIRALRQLLKKRGDWQRLFKTKEQLDYVIRMSGGNIRGLFRMVRQIILVTKTLPVSDETIELALNQLRMEFLPIANDEARWLAVIAKTHTASLCDYAQVSQFANLIQRQLIHYQLANPIWYDVHPLVRGQILAPPDEWN